MCFERITVWSGVTVDEDQNVHGLIGLSVQTGELVRETFQPKGGVWM